MRERSGLFVSHPSRWTSEALLCSFAEVVQRQQDPQAEVQLELEEAAPEGMGSLDG